ncbi:methyltransferase domain-containing protein [Paenibacillus endoradicis]|uniref:methyltransferase domain-containing protein n=1 Tax=Paenibacillus endoradicis TaxID=2972487 RepID=UPI002158B250|nr:methyltransferase domain-containing protein [Paenibacillus endoradicis]MCR8659102.1 methyltransferase domain-containing protein [Paenibacillus endoradicis]
MKIKEVADRLKISQRAIRFYEDKGLITPSKQDDNQYRMFDEEDIWRLQTIIALRESGMAVSDIRAALSDIEAQGNSQLRYFLELQRSVMFSKWVEMKQIIETTDEMIETLKENHVLPLDDIYTLAEGSRRLREQRAWQDKWGFDSLASVHDQLVKEDKQKYRDYDEALRLIVKWVSPIFGERGLDIGTGTGNLLGRLINEGAVMAGVDQSNEMLKECQRKFSEIETKLGNFLALPYLDGKFDFVVSSFALHHLTRVQTLMAIQEMRRVLKTHGRICIADLMIDREECAVCEDDEEYIPLYELVNLFENNGYITKHLKINELLHVVLAVPIR